MSYIVHTAVLWYMCFVPSMFLRPVDFKRSLLFTFDSTIMHHHRRHAGD